jgi:hypothetical protein
MEAKATAQGKAYMGGKEYDKKSVFSKEAGCSMLWKDQV